MNKVFLYSLLFVASFLLLWFGLSQVNWMSVFRVAELTRKSEQKLGELLYNLIESDEILIKNDSITYPVQRIVDRLCAANELNNETVKLHIVQHPEVNAFTLPDGHILLHSGLILACDNQHELAGVLAHEIAHVKLRHVMKMLYKELGVALVASALSPTGNKSANNPLHQIMETISAKAFDRSLEKEADLEAVSLMQKAKFDSKGLADFLKKMANKQSTFIKNTTWLQTHPNSDDRYRYIMDAHQSSNDIEYILTSDEWNLFLDNVKSLH